MEDFYDRPTSPKKSPLPRARMHLRARLGWLWGYPLAQNDQGLRWQQLYFPMPWDTDQSTITPSHLAQASTTANRLLHDFPKALPKLVGDVDNWHAAVRRKLQAIRALLDGQTIDPVPALLPDETRQHQRLRQLIRDIARQQVSLRPLLESFVWWLSLEPDTLSEALHWLQTEQAQLLRLLEIEGNAITTCLTLFALAQKNSAKEAAYLLTLATHPVWGEQNIHARRQWIATLREKQQHLDLGGVGGEYLLHELRQPFKASRFASANTTALSYQDWEQWIHDLLPKRRKERRQHLQILQQVLPIELLQHWQQQISQYREQATQLDRDMQAACQHYDLFEQQWNLQQRRQQTLRAKLARMPIQPGAKIERMVLVAEIGEVQRHCADAEAEQMQQLEQLREVLPSALVALDALLSALSYLPTQRSFPKLMAFALQQATWLGHFQKLLHRLEPQHEWYGPDRLLRLLCYWQREDALYDAKLRDTDLPLNQVLREWGDSLSGILSGTEPHGPQQLNRRLSPWGYLLQRPYGYLQRRDNWEAFSLCSGVHDDEAKQFKGFLSHLGKLCDRHELDAGLANGFHKFYLHAPRQWPLVDFFAVLLEQDLCLQTYIPAADYHYLDRLLGAAYGAEDFVRLVKAWGLFDPDFAVAEAEREDIDDLDERRELLPVAVELAAVGWSEVVDFFLVSGQLSYLKRLQPLIMLYLNRQRHIPAPVTFCNQPVDCSGYPEVLHPALVILQRCHPDAEKAARRILAKTFPDPADLGHEMMVLEQKIDLAEGEQQPAMQKRLQNLQQRLLRPPELSASQLDKLERKLRHAAYSKLLENWYQQCQHALQDTIRDSLYLSEIPPAWLEDKYKRRILMALTDLDMHQRKLAGLLLTARIKGQGQDLRDLPPNQQWRLKMEKAGFALQPWLASYDFPYVHQADTDEVVHLRLRFADDVFEIFQMGDYFDTCLSHDSFNFFSVVSNAADLNKRVLYAHDADGKVIGRCLLGISAEQRLLSYFPYTSLERELFKRAISAFLQHLEQAMGIQRSDSGSIPVLLGNDWYDDGVATPMPDYKALHPGSKFRQQLKTLRPEQILPTFQQANDSNSLDSFAVRRLITLPGLRDDSECLHAILQQAQQLGISNPRLNEIIVERLLEQKQLSYTRIWPLAKGWVVARIREQLPYGVTDAFYAYLDLVLAADKNLFLRVLRKIEKPFREEQGHSDFYVYRARAFKAVNRPRQAQENYQLAIDNYQKGYGSFNRWTPKQVRKEMSVAFR